MKVKAPFLFLSYIAVAVFFANSYKAFAQKALDSLDYYYKSSQDKNNEIPFRLKQTDKLIDLATKNNNTTFLLMALNNKSFLYAKLDNYKHAIAVAKTLLEAAKKEKDTSKQLLAYRKLADYSRRNDSLVNAFGYYQEHKALNVLLADSLEIIRDLRFMSSIQYKLGLLYESESTAVEAIQILDLLKPETAVTNAKIGIYNHLGIIYKEIGNYKSALELYAKLLPMTTNVNYLNIIHNNIANVYKEQQKYELAIVEFKKVYDISLSLGDQTQIARALNNMAFAKGKLNKPEALSELKRALDLRKVENEYSDLFSSYISLAEYYKDRGDNKNLKYYATNAYDISNKTKNSLDKIEALSFLVELDKSANIEAYKNLIDSVARAKQINENKYAFVKYNYNKKDKEAQDIKIKYIQSELEVEKEKFNTLMFQFIGALLMLIMGFTYLILKSKHKKDKLQVVFDTETRISKKVHDEVANDVYHAMTKLQNNSNNQEELLDDLEHIYQRTRDISKGISDIDVKTNFKDLLYDLLISYKSDNVSVIAKNLSVVDWKIINYSQRITLYRVLQELMTNMRKHSKATIVLISFNQTQNKLHIDYKDNGVGCQLVKHNGLSNTENRMESINGTITFESEIDKGFKATITI